ncbi:beta-galactosidase BoGH2A precursor [mine drainage metagenome]|uniref:Beta-galactosidase BoGH2A n=1 Tax=mine drainage metagenome TaxID=410659 RepID=A0A1J5SAP3_9ZZZZ
MKKNLRLLVVFTLILISANINAQSVREKISLDEGWKFHLGNSSDPKKDFNYGITNIFSKAGEAGNTCINPSFNDDSWRNVDVPHDWVVELPFEKSSNFEMDSHGYKPIGAAHPENNIGWYRKTFFVDAKDSGNKYVLQFDGVYRDCKVFINGHYLGSNFSGYMGFELDVTDYLHFRNKNVITVRVDASQFEGWFYEGAGIYRHVWLNKMHPLHIASYGTYVQTKTIGNNASIITETKIQNQLYTNAAAEIQSYVIDKAGKKVASFAAQKINLKVNEIKTINQIATVVSPNLWSIETPYLYKLISLVKENGKTIDSVVTKFGIRTIVVDKDKGLFINGKFVKVLGTCNHQDHAGVGSAVPDALQYYRIKLLKEMGDNAYRTSHNPPTPELLEACDELGMIVLDENRLLGSSEEVMSQFERLILRDRNHPSVFMWSLANEEHGLQYTDVAKRIAYTLIAKQKELDPSRTSTYAADMGNIKRGINEAIPVRGFNYNLKGIDPYRKDNPDQPIIGTEMASTVCTRGIYINDTIKGYVPDYDSIFPPWASRAETWWKLAADRDWFMGGFIWTGFDYRGEPTPYTWPCINSHFGVMDVCGFPKNDYYYYQSWWTNKDVLHIFPHWNWKGKEGQPIRVDVNSNADEVELFLNDKSLGKQTMQKNSHLSWNVNYEPGTLKAIGWKSGRQFETKIETTDEAYQIVATPDRTSIAADGKDVAVFNITVVDKKGREVPDAMNMLRFNVSNAMIIGVGNGDPSSHEPDKYWDGKYQRSLFNGKCQVIVQSFKSKGDINFEATGNGLVVGKVAIKAE